jgi:hypothetical protein
MPVAFVCLNSGLDERRVLVVVPLPDDLPHFILPGYRQTVKTGSSIMNQDRQG